MHTKLSSKDKKNIKNAVQKIERTTSGEIVTYFINKSSNYFETSLVFTLFAIISLLFVIILMSDLWLLPFRFSPESYSFFILLFAVLIFIISYFIKPIKRLLISKQKKVETVFAKAQEVFLKEEVFNTKNRTGVLIFISSFEHQVQILTDKGIEKFLKPEEKNEMLKLIIDGIKNNKPAEGIVQAIHLYGNLLVKAGYEIKEDDKNELSDEIRTEI